MDQDKYRLLSAEKRKKPTNTKQVMQKTPQEITQHLPQAEWRSDSL